MTKTDESKQNPSTPPVGQGTRDRLLSSAIHLLARHGLEGTGSAALLDACGTTKGSLYHFFPGGKHQVVAEALSLYSESLLSGLMRRFDEAPTSGQALASFIESVARHQQREGFAGSCPIAAVALDVPRNDPLGEHCHQLLGHWALALAEKLSPAEPSAGLDLAEWVIATFEGALLMSKVRQSATPLRLAADQLRRALDG